MARREPSPARPPSAAPAGYALRDGCIVRQRLTRYGMSEDTLAYFEARIIQEILLDDGEEIRRYLHIEGRLPHGQTLPPLLVPAEEYSAMAWVTRGWGSRAIVAAGPSRRDALREAILHLSGPVPQQHRYAHTGWRCIGHRWAFLHAGGAIGCPDVQVQLPANLQGYRLPNPPGRDEAARALRTSLRFLQLAPRQPEVGYTLLAAVYRAPLLSFVPHNTVLWLYGPSGAFKTTCSTLALCHFGHFDAPPETWLSTPNALESTLHLAGDVPVLIDDWAPARWKAEALRLQDAAEILIRRVGNRAARHRLRADLSRAPERPPRAGVLVTAEELPTVRLSAVARIFPLPVEPGAVKTAVLAELHAARGTLARAGAAYIQWLADALQGGGLAQDLPRVQQALRRSLTTRGHPRVSANVASLALGLDTLLACAEDLGAISPAQHSELYEEGMQRLAALAEHQQGLLQEEDPGDIFLAALDELLAAGRAALVPRHATATTHVPVLGYYDAHFAYLIPHVAYEAVTRLLSAGRPLGVSPRTLWQALERAGRIVRDGPHLLAKLRLPDGRRVRVVRLHARALAFLAGEVGPLGPQWGQENCSQGRHTGDGPSGPSGPLGEDGLIRGALHENSPSLLQLGPLGPGHTNPYPIKLEPGPTP